MRSDDLNKWPVKSQKRYVEHKRDRMIERGLVQCVIQHVTQDESQDVNQLVNQH